MGITTLDYPPGGKSRKLGCLVTFFRSGAQDPMREVLFETGTLMPRIEHTKRVGKPRAHWLLETCQDAFAAVDPNAPFDISNSNHMMLLATLAQQRHLPFQTHRRNTLSSDTEIFIQYFIEFLQTFLQRLPPGRNHSGDVDLLSIPWIQYSFYFSIFYLRASVPNFSLEH